MPDRRPLLEQSRKYDWIERCLGCQALNKPIILAHEQCPLTRAAFVTTTEKRNPQIIVGDFLLSIVASLGLAQLNTNE